MKALCILLSIALAAGLQAAETPIKNARLTGASQVPAASTLTIGGTLAFDPASALDLSGCVLTLPLIPWSTGISGRPTTFAGYSLSLVNVPATLDIAQASITGGQLWVRRLQAGSNVTIAYDPSTEAALPGTSPIIISATGGGGGGGTVTDVSVATANGFSGTVASSTTTPAISINTTVTGLLKGNGSTVSAATSGTDFLPITGGSGIVTTGTITTGTWNGTTLTGLYGGTGVINSGKTITLGGNLTTSGAFATTLTSTATTSVTLPTTGTLSTLAGSETLTNKSIAGSQLTGAYTAGGQTMATAKLLGRTTSSTGAVEEISAGTGLTLSGGTLVVAIGSSVQAWDADLDTWATKTAPSGTVVGTSDTQTLTNKTIANTQLTGAYTSSPETMGTGKLLGRTTASTGAVEEISAGSGITISGGTISASGGSSGDIIVCEDQQVANTASGAYGTANTWVTRTLNTKTVDTASLATLTSNHIVLPAGNYEVYMRAPMVGCGGTMSRLRDTTNSVTLLVSSGGYSGTTGAEASNDNLIIGYFTLSGTANVEVQNFAGTSNSNTFALGYKLTGNTESERYTRIMLRKR